MPGEAPAPAAGSSKRGADSEGAGARHRNQVGCIAVANCKCPALLRNLLMADGVALEAGYLLSVSRSRNLLLAGHRFSCIGLRDHGAGRLAGQEAALSRGGMVLVSRHAG